ncbi:SpoIIE family protein phosphatase [Streptomyces himalayensis]|uniref:SpoIIE family protein phosphatase n=1 Tax=Streptomyces himalayensis subsp. himalayensis TaxID=2756131 RepID=A0A7W0ICR6_9ACTN|nr:SpoIIE family protein phosphatase [Streptomyces himalayensis]MBA2950930.1 SpoIIE family protein phosphatase [Streptomyces himalayensis subsp. himalayensis]
MAVSGIDYAALFAATPSPYLVLGPDLVIVEVNQAYLDATGRTREDLIGQHIFDAFPDNPADPEADGVRNLNTSLQRVLALRQPDTMALQKYDIPAMGRLDVFEERWWSPINTPVLGPDGSVAWIIHRVEDVTAFVKTRASRAQPSTGPVAAREVLEAELYARARELQLLNEELRQAHTRERHVAVALQEAMLQVPDLARHQGVAVRYLPATGSLNVCGDWYDMVDLADGRFAVAVGDVVGHGLEAAAVMGMLRSALSAAIRALERPAQALEVLGLYARSVEGALNTTAVQALVDPVSCLIIYSNAGHPPPVLVHADGCCELLDRATDPPLAVRPQHVPRPQASATYGRGDTLVLYTDGLIERRGEDLDAGLNRLTDILGQYCRLDSERLADTLLTRLGLAGGGRDDTALIIVRL